MADKVKTLAEWEKEKGFIVTGDVDPNKKITEAEVDDIEMGKKHWVNHADRVKFLKENNYEVTRENMIADLSARGEDADTN